MTRLRWGNPDRGARTAHRTVPSTAAVFVAMCATTGCTSLTTAAREKFAGDYACPSSEVTAAARPAIHAHELLDPPLSPPSDVREDPARLAVWRKQQSDLDAVADRRTVVEVAGCGHSVRYACIDDSDYEDASAMCLAPLPAPSASPGPGRGP